MLKAAPSLEKTLSRYAETRALVGGMTAIQGASGKFPNSDGVARPQRRPVDLRPAQGPLDHRPRPDDARRHRDADHGQIDSGEVNAVYIHLAEGVDNDARGEEFAALVDAGLLTPATVIIHGTALEPSRARRRGGRRREARVVAAEQPAPVRRDDAGRPAALDRGIAGGPRRRLAAERQPEPARRAEGRAPRLIEQGRPATPASSSRWSPPTRRAIAGLDDKLGLLEAGRPADVVVLERTAPDPWEAVVQSPTPSCVELVMLGGDVAYGRRRLGAHPGGTPPAGPDPAGPRP